MNHLRSTIAAALALLTLTGCGAAGSSAVRSTEGPGGAGVTAPTRLPGEPGTVTIGSASFPEAELLAYLYAEALRTRGVTVTVHPNIGERATYMTALADGSIDAVPEYTGALLNYLDRDSTDKSSAEVFAALEQQAAAAGYVVGSYSPAEDVDTLTVTADTARKYELTSIGDLQRVAPTLTLGAPAAFRTVPYGTRAIEDVYGVEFGRFVPLSPTGSITRTALLNGTVDVADIFSTDPSIRANGFVVLEDPRDVFAAQNVVPVFRADAVTQPMLDAANELSASLTTDDLVTEVTKVVDGQDPAIVARSWVGAHVG